MSTTMHDVPAVLGQTRYRKHALSPFGRVLWRLRQRPAGVLSQSRLAERAGLNHTYISRLESGDRVPTRDAVTAIADALEAIPEERDALLMAAGFLPEGHGELLAVWSRVPRHLRDRIMAVIEAVADDVESEAA